MVACVEWMKWSGVSDSMFPCGCAFSALTLLVGRQKGHPACKKLEWWGAGVVICLERGADLHVAQLMPLPLTVSCFSEILIGFSFLVPAHPGSPGQRAVKRVCVVAPCSCVHMLWCHGISTVKFLPYVPTELVRRWKNGAVIRQMLLWLDSGVAPTFSMGRRIKRRCFHRWSAASSSVVGRQTDAVPLHRPCYILCVQC